MEKSLKSGSGNDSSESVKVVNVSTKVLRFGGRDILTIETEGLRQAFYRSTGRNSGREGVWFPFDGVSVDGVPLHFWFHKSRFKGKGELYRFGLIEYKVISDFFGKTRYS